MLGIEQTPGLKQTQGSWSNTWVPAIHWLCHSYRKL